MLIVQDVIEPSYRKRYKRSYRIVAPRKRASYGVALAAVYGVEADCTVKNVRSCVNRVCKHWVDRLWELGCHELWLYQRGLLPDPDAIQPQKLVRAFELYADCRPRCVAYMLPQPWENELEDYKPCNRANFCPHCWASVTARQTQRVKHVINAHIASSPQARLSLSVTVDEHFLSSAGIGGLGFSTPVERHAGIIRLRDELQKCKNYVARTSKAVQRNTLASFYRLCAIPADQGWRVQIRRLFLVEGSEPWTLPPMRFSQRAMSRAAFARGGLTWAQRKANGQMDEDIYRCLIEFNRYPLDYLTGDSELAAVYLNAAARMRLIGGTGKLRRAGTALVREYVQQESEARHARAARRAKAASRN